MRGRIGSIEDTDSGTAEPFTRPGARAQRPRAPGERVTRVEHYGSSTALITCTMPFLAEMSVAAMLFPGLTGPVIQERVSRSCSSSRHDSGNAGIAMMSRSR